MVSIPLALAGFWFGFVLAMVGSLLVLRKSAGRNLGERASPSADPTSHARPKASLSSPWVAPAGAVIIGLVVILLLCPQTFSADFIEVSALVNDPVAYDLQAGYVGAAGGTSLSYQVDAVPQSGNCPLGFGYFVNAYVNDSGQVYWYQVALSYDWGGGTIASSGWGLAYEVFGPDGSSIYPELSGGAGVAPFSGAVNSGDSVDLALTLGSGSVSFTGSDSTTGASASLSYPQTGAMQFGGGMPSQNVGYFTGVLTECYRDTSASPSLDAVTYTEQEGSQSQAGVFVEEINFSWGRLPYLPSLELGEMHTNFDPVGLAPTYYQAYGLTLQYGSTTFVTASS